MTMGLVEYFSKIPCWVKAGVGIGLVALATGGCAGSLRTAYDLPVELREKCVGQAKIRKSGDKLELSDVDSAFEKAINDFYDHCKNEPINGVFIDGTKDPDLLYFY